MVEFKPTEQMKRISVISQNAHAFATAIDRTFGMATMIAMSSGLPEERAKRLNEAVESGINTAVVILMMGIKDVIKGNVEIKEEPDETEEPQAQGEAKQ